MNLSIDYIKSILIYVLALDRYITLVGRKTDEINGMLVSGLSI